MLEKRSSKKEKRVQFWNQHASFNFHQHQNQTNRFFSYKLFPSVTRDVGVGVLEYICDCTCFEGWGKKAEAKGGGNNVIY